MSAPGRQHHGETYDPSAMMQVRSRPARCSGRSPQFVTITFSSPHSRLSNSWSPLGAAAVKRSDEGGMCRGHALTRSGQRSAVAQGTRILRWVPTGGSTLGLIRSEGFPWRGAGWGQGRRRLLHRSIEDDKRNVRWGVFVPGITWICRLGGRIEGGDGQ